MRFEIALALSEERVQIEACAVLLYLD